MATKGITGSYSSGYYLNPAFTTLDIASSAYVGGAGVTTTASHASTVHTLETVPSDGNIGNNGITLNAGGAVINGSSTNTSATITSGKAIVAYNAAAKVTNYGTIFGGG